MNERQATTAFGALSQETRLRIVRLLVQAGTDGMAAGAIAEAVDVSPSNVSFHLKDLEHAGLITARREARSIIYSADYPALTAIIQFLMKDCCAGRPEICAPAFEKAFCPPAKKGKRAYA
ncbi:MAG: metalloregulator ArsR/SmtB family transcription factor [Pseudorhodoplanes sp.]|jgi:DNA-binding transcriptional ArsR family regulator|nr:metalloregulator ArsR/SmtB family transcription factor [Pseudorhodoplanes sp.]